jgi:hypothetical protein
MSRSHSNDENRPATTADPSAATTPPAPVPRASDGRTPKGPSPSTYAFVAPQAPAAAAAGAPPAPARAPYPPLPIPASAHVPTPVHTAPIPVAPPRARGVAPSFGSHARETVPTLPAQARSVPPAIPSPGDDPLATRPDVAEARAASMRPAAPDLPLDRAPSPSIADTFELLLADDIEAGFAAIERKTGRTLQLAGAQGLASSDVAEVRTLFAELATIHMRQVRDLMIDLRWGGEATVDWIGICAPAVRSLRRAAEKLELTDLAAALEQLEAALVAAGTAGHTIRGDARDRVMERYEALALLLPQAFTLDMDRSQREAVILQSLLLQIPDVKKVTIDKLYAAGLVTLETMFLARADDVAATTGIALPLAARIVERFRAYKDEIKGSLPSPAAALDRLGELAARLGQQHGEYEQAADAWTDAAKARKKELRHARAQTLLDIHVALARLGEVERLRELDRLPFARKVAHVVAYVEEARERRVPGS